jgi:hypothetical protein
MELYDGRASQVLVQQGYLLSRQLFETGCVRGRQPYEHLSACVVLVGRGGLHEDNAMRHMVDDVCCQNKSFWLGEEGYDGYESLRVTLHDLLGGSGVPEAVDYLEGKGEEEKVRGRN